MLTGGASGDAFQMRTRPAATDGDRNAGEMKREGDRRKSGQGKDREGHPMQSADMR